MKIQSFLAKFGTLVILLTIIIFSLLVPGYDHFSQTISELNSKTAIYRTQFNIFLSLGFLLIVPSCVNSLLRKNFFFALSGALILLGILIVLTMTWFVPMDATAGIRTASDDAHNAMISVAVSLILLSQISNLIAFSKSKQKREFYLVLTIFVLALIFGLMSLYANLNMLELINIAERGWMILFLIYLFIFPDWMNFAGRKSKS
ncbi:MAG: hypothetical protein BWY43_00564 [candidate division WS2 bacterium ADurb.Bin280]|uniref:DUF998 domain-containing protein n=1 Tax=candidate division WS2 bacterium ADurb.Bin280 TaxID=1852829 RepID=A0A1V5SCQ8_9BACT|nr:MAG: hypothetical protein BWY43_00564 [candidate division WS2 bacterium ADurb.Bin280]